MVRSGRKKKAAKRTQQLSLSCSEWLPPFCHDLIALINSRIDPTRKLCLLPFWCFSVILVSCSLPGNPVLTLKANQTLSQPWRSQGTDLRLCQNQLAEINKKKTISQCWASALSGWTPFAYGWHQSIAEIADLVVASWCLFTKGFFEPFCTTWNLVLNTLRPGFN